ncbi:MAG: TraB/GumN family protein [Paracoccaceae bacterium]
MLRQLSKTLAAAAIFALSLASLPAMAECYGLNLLDLMPADERAQVQAAADAVRYPQGNFWLAEKDGAQITVIGTYHLDDPRHVAALDHFGPVIAKASALLVEAGPDEEKALMARMVADPSVLTITTGPTLYEMLPKETWDRLASATSARGVPGFMAAKFQPWYINVLLSMPPCALEDLTSPKGLDGQLIDAAIGAGVPVHALEPYDTIFAIFGDMSQVQQIEMIEQALAMEDKIADFSVTLADTYFDGSSRLMWELMRHESLKLPGMTPEQVDADMAQMEQSMMISRNLAWIPVIEEAAAKGPLVVAFGALHLSGTDGVLALLADRGWAISPVVLP